jgi:hypothetical protein
MEEKAVKENYIGKGSKVFMKIKTDRMQVIAFLDKHPNI